MSLYDALGVASDATPDELTAAFRRMSKAHHPDAGGDAEVFARVTHAAAILRDPAKRAEYDATGREDFREQHPDAGAFAQLCHEFSTVFGEFVTGAIGTHIDLIKRAKGRLLNQARDQKAELEKVKAMHSRCASALARLARKDGEVGSLDNLLAERHRQLGEIIEQMTVQIALFERAAELADEWDWRTDPRPAPADFEPISGGPYFDTRGHVPYGSTTL